MERIKIYNELKSFSLGLSKICNSLFLLLFLGFFFSIDTSASKRDNLDEVWIEVGVDKQINNKWAFSLWANSFHNATKGNYERYFEPAIKYHISNKFHIEGIYRRDYFIENENWTYENRSALRIAYKTKLRNINFRNRHKLELRTFELSSSEIRYRSDFKISPNWNFTKMKLNPYLQEEIFLSQQKVSRVRSYFGIAGELGSVQPTVYFLLQTDNEIAAWENNPIVGVMLAVSL